MAELTPAEERITFPLVRGLSNKAIAREVHCAEKTVRAHLHSIYKKLGVSNRVQAAVAIVRADQEPSV